MTSTSSRMSLSGLVFRFVLLVVFILLATWGAHGIREALNLEIMPENEQQVHRSLMLGMVAYIVLLALPFVPGAEIGIAILAAFGAAIAPLIYVATVAAMMLAYVIGRFLPVSALARVLQTLRLRRAAQMVAQAAELSGHERLEMMLKGAPGRTTRLALRFRYVALALAVNTPGNSIIGGGGGIMMMAGLSGVFSPIATLLAIMIAVAPVPLAVMFLGLSL